MYCSVDDTFNVSNLTRFLNAEQESLCLEEDLVAKHMTEYLEYCEKSLNDKLQFTAIDVSKHYFIYVIQILNLIKPTVNITPYFNNLKLSILFFNM